MTTDLALHSSWPVGRSCGQIFVLYQPAGGAGDKYGDTQRAEEQLNSIPT